MPYSDPRDDITDSLLQQQKMGPVGAGFAGLAGAMPATMPTQMPAGMPQTPAGGVPGSGLAPMAGPSFNQAPVQPPMGAMQQMPMLGGMNAPQQQAAIPAGQMQPGIARKQRMM